MTNNDDIEDDYVSKSQLKRDADAMQALGKKLTRLKPNQLKQLPLSEDVEEAVKDYINLPNSHGAQRRQLQFIGKLIRKSDASIIETALKKLESPGFSAKKPAQKNPLAQAAVQILSVGGDAIEQALNKHKDLERKQLRQLHREYVKSDDKKQAALVRRCVELLENSQ